jgi:hypothetical protein
MEMFQGYTYDEAVRIINHFAQRLRSIEISTYDTPSRNLVTGKAQDFMPLPFNPKDESYEVYVFNYKLAPVKSDWIQAKRREPHRWLPFVVINGEYMPLVPVLAGLHIWDEEWRTA